MPQKCSYLATNGLVLTVCGGRSLFVDHYLGELKSCLLHNVLVM